MPSLREVEAIQKQHSDSEEVSVRAVPAAILPFIAAIGSCVVGALGGAAVGELVSKIRHGHRLEAEARVDALIVAASQGQSLRCFVLSQTLQRSPFVMPY